ncbi:MAG TPA: metal-dependent transcriptional regulator [Chthonomonadales bacterium]|nr:metal-dependent transcriptional regulator [Chthonomonadales bacterium]
MELTSTMEDYLEAVLRLSRRQRVVRIRDIANLLGVAPSSATGAVQTLKKRGLLSHERYEDVSLTHAGREVAARVDRRHEELRAFLEAVLLLDPRHAEKEACRLEHSISEVTLERLRRFATALRLCGVAGPGCMRTFRLSLEPPEAPSSEPGVGAPAEEGRSGQDIATEQI